MFSELAGYLLEWLQYSVQVICCKVPVMPCFIALNFILYQTHFDKTVVLAAASFQRSFRHFRCHFHQRFAAHLWIYGTLFLLQNTVILHNK